MFHIMLVSSEMCRVHLTCAISAGTTFTSSLAQLSIVMSDMNSATTGQVFPFPTSPEVNSSNSTPKASLDGGPSTSALISPALNVEKKQVLPTVNIIYQKKTVKARIDKGVSRI
jgi:hypothetical protein